MKQCCKVRSCLDLLSLRLDDLIINFHDDALSLPLCSFLEFVTHIFLQIALHLAYTENLAQRYYPLSHENFDLDQ